MSTVRELTTPHGSVQVEVPTTAYTGQELMSLLVDTDRASAFQELLQCSSRQQLAQTLISNEVADLDMFEDETLMTLIFASSADIMTEATKYGLDVHTANADVDTVFMTLIRSLLVVQSLHKLATIRSSTGHTGTIPSANTSATMSANTSMTPLTLPPTSAVNQPLTVPALTPTLTPPLTPVTTKVSNTSATSTTHTTTTSITTTPTTTTTNTSPSTQPPPVTTPPTLTYPVQGRIDQPHQHRQYILSMLAARIGGIDNEAIARMTNEDVAFLAQLYDSQMCAGTMAKYLQTHNTTMTWCMHETDVNYAGKTWTTVDKARVTSAKIVLTRSVFVRARIDAVKGKVESGIRVYSPAEALLLTFEHELIHLLRKIGPNPKASNPKASNAKTSAKTGAKVKDPVYSSHGKMFKDLTSAYFGHSGKATHELFGNVDVDVAALKAQLKLGCKVAYKTDAKSCHDCTWAVVVKLNPQRVEVLTDTNKRYLVPYTSITQVCDDAEAQERYRQLQEQTGALTVGQAVTFAGPHGGVLRGIIRQKKIKNAMVATADGYVYTVAMTALTVVP